SAVYYKRGHLSPINRQAGRPEGAGAIWVQAQPAAHRRCAGITAQSTTQPGDRRERARSMCRLSLLCHTFPRNRQKRDDPLPPREPSLQKLPSPLQFPPRFTTIIVVQIGI